MLARVRLPLLWKFFTHKNLQCVTKLVYLKRGYISNFNTCGYFQLIKQSLSKNFVVTREINLKNEEVLQIEEGSINVFSFFFSIVFVIIRIVVITCIAFGLLTLYCIARVLHIKDSPIIYLKAVEFLGPTFIKLGQWMSTRRDLYSKEFCFTLSRLQRNTSAHSWFYTRHVLRQAYGSNWDEIFVQFDRIPVGSGCCAQVYRAVVDVDTDVNSRINRNMKPSMFVVRENFNVKKKEINTSACNVKPVAVKILHPRIRERMRQDLSILRFFSMCATYIVPSLQWLSFNDCINEFSQMMEKQVDLNYEANNLDRFAKNFRRALDVSFPKPHHSLSFEQVLVESYHIGRPINEYLDENDPEFRHKLAVLGLNTVFKMDNFVHCDLHPGNILVQERSELTIFDFPKISRSPSLLILDCGLVAELTEACRRNFRDVFKSVADRDGRRAADLLMSHSVHKSHDPEGFRNALEKIVDKYLNDGVKLENINVSKVMSEVFAAMVEYQVKQDALFSSIVLSIAVIEGLGRSLDPEVDLLRELSPHLINDFIS